jgi:predicted NBD/HSP70 family sugar kinase
MSEFLFGLSDVGGTQQRVEVWNGDMELVGAVNGNVDPADYYGSVESIAYNMRQIADGNGELVAVSVAVASELDREKRMVLGGALSTWDGKCIGADVGEAAGLPVERSGTLNDMEAVAESQLAVNAARGIYENGYVTTLSSGWGGKPYSRDGKIGYDSPGHADLRPGGQCPCGGHGHTEAYVSGNGILLNQGVSAAEWLADRDNARGFVADLSTSTIALIERNSKEFSMDVIRWMGGVHNGQPVLMARAEEKVRNELGPKAPLWEAVTLAGKAGLHGAYIDAQRRAKAA